MTLDWNRISRELDADGFSVAGRLLTPDTCQALRALYSEDRPWRKQIVMARHGYGRGEYRYFAYPLPDPVQRLRQTLYPQLATVANRWAERLGESRRFPDTLEDFTALCREAGQTRATPLMLKYGPGDYNRLHQDLYGELVFPLQVAVVLNEPGRDFEGGEFVLVEQSPRRQSKAEVVPLKEGEGAIFAVRERPVEGGRGWYMAQLRHGVSRIRSGERMTLGVIFHDAAG